MFKKHIILNTLHQWFPTTFMEAPQLFTFCISPLSDTPDSGLGVSTDDLSQVCLIKVTWKTCSVGGPPGTWLGTTALHYCRSIIVKPLSNALFSTKSLLSTSAVCSDWPAGTVHCDWRQK